jgi:hypothetical protein
MEGMMVSCYALRDMPDGWIAPDGIVERRLEVIQDDTG